MAAASVDRATIKSRWTALYKKALDADTWGQALEASDFYTEYNHHLKNTTVSLCAFILSFALTLIIQIGSDYGTPTTYHGLGYR